jgi:cytochrome c peroxidase
MARAVQSLLFACLFCLLLPPAAADPLAGPKSRAEVRREATALAELGRRLFADPALSASGTLSCASCHDPKRAFGPPNQRAVQLGGSDMRQAGVRAVPSLRYLQVTPSFTEHFFESEDEADESIDNGPSGGLTWDGRADRGAEQAQLPLLSPLEMANASPDAVVSKALGRGYGSDLARIFGAALLADRATVFKAILKAFEVYEQDRESFYPYSSKYDGYLAGKVALSAQEARGLALFDDPGKGNCAACHVSKRGGDGTPPQFTDYGLIALAVPRNAEIPANADPAYHDLGLCGPYRTDLADHPDYCGLFKTPSLRNVALRGSFFHNGVFHDLREAVAFYATRDTDPGRWYPRRADGRIARYDDLPARYWANIDPTAPLDRIQDEAPALNPAEIDDIVAFLRTLTDADMRDAAPVSRAAAGD